MRGGKRLNSGRPRSAKTETISFRVRAELKNELFAMFKDIIKIETDKLTGKTEEL